VMEGFLRIRIRPWLRRLISRGLAIIPAALFIMVRGEGAVDELLVLSQVVLSLQLSFAVVPLILFTSDKKKMGEFANRPWVVALAALTAAIIVGLNGNLVAQQVAGWLAAAGPKAFWLGLFVLPVVAAAALLLVYIAAAPLLARIVPALERVPLPPIAPATPRRTPARLRAASPGARYRRIAVALELGPADRAVLDHVREMALADGCEVVLLHVAESAASRYLGPESSDQESREDQVSLESLAVELAAAGIPAETRLGHGDVKQELARLVEETGADLLITGSHGHRLLQDLIYGSTASGLRHLVRVPVLTVPAGKKREH
jgi:manganese transport protein